MIKPKNRNHLDFKTFREEILKDPQIKAEYDRLQPEYALIQAIIDVRVQKGITQKELAQKIGTKQSVISRLESGRANPSVSFLKKLARGLDSHLEVKFVSP
jgi:ribosome-binding protein aMBF1 (putative translation factor)